MEFQIGLENNLEGRSIAWVLGYPGCFADGKDGTEALAAAPQAIQAYMGWIGAHTAQSWLPDEAISVQKAETFECFVIGEDFELNVDGYEVNAWFRHDWKPLTEEDVARGLQVLVWSRAELLAAVAGLSSAMLERRYPGERWNIAGILRHVGGAEWWYLDRLGQAFPRQAVPADPFERLEKVRQHLLQTLPGLVGSRQVVGVDGEFWSPRKLLRRAAWHERDHTRHILKLR
jgi:predicted RNase H-like HicB family nuclease